MKWKECKESKKERKEIFKKSNIKYTNFYIKKLKDQLLSTHGGIKQSN